jgi:hypothetical protein
MGSLPNNIPVEIECIVEIDARARRAGAAAPKKPAAKKAAKKKRR